MQKRFTTALVAIIFVAGAMSCAKVQFYQDPMGPVVFPAQKQAAAREGDSLNVVTFNIKKARKIQLAISELQQFEKQQKVDVYLLQEMDEKGAAAIAKELDLNYLYIPIVYDKADKKDIGNAILTRGNITRPEKLILPHAKWTNWQRRHVTIGEVDINDKKILVYSVHTETLTMSRKDRFDQIDGIINHAKMQSANYKYVVMGGDFNTLLPKDGRMVVERFTGSGFDWSTEKVGTTARAMLGLVKPRHDYLFTSGLQVVNAYKVAPAESSDHYPVFATFRYKG